MVEGLWQCNGGVAEVGLLPRVEWSESSQSAFEAYIHIGKLLKLFYTYHIIITACKMAELAWPTSIHLGGREQVRTVDYTLNFIEERGEKE